MFFLFNENLKFYKMRNVTFRFVFMLYYGIKYPHQCLIFALVPHFEMLKELQDQLFKNHV